MVLDLALEIDDPRGTQTLAEGLEAALGDTTGLMLLRQRDESRGAGGVRHRLPLESAVSYLKIAAVWADWLVCEIHYEPDRHGRIASVRVRPDLGQTVGLGDVVELSRDEVLRRLGRGETFATVYAVNGRWNYGAPIVAERHGGTGLGGQPFFYLRTVADGVRRDNLGELPTY